MPNSECKKALADLPLCRVIKLVGEGSRDPNENQIKTQRGAFETGSVPLAPHSSKWGDPLAHDPGNRENGIHALDSPSETLGECGGKNDPRNHTKHH
jgi:hypothetical protein